MVEVLPAGWQGTIGRDNSHHKSHHTLQQVTEALLQACAPGRLVLDDESVDKGAREVPPHMVAQKHGHRPRSRAFVRA